MTLAPLLLAARLALAATPPASPLLPPDHWAVEAVRRLHEVGLAPEWMPAQRAAPLLAVGGALAEAAERAGRERSPYAALARAWRERFADEFSGAAAALGERGAPGGADAPALRLLSGRATLGYAHGETSPLPSSAPRPPWALELAAPRPDPFAELAGAAALGPHLAAGAAGQATRWDASFATAELVGAAGPVALSVGRAPLRYGPNEIGAVVAGGATVDRVEFMTTAPVRLPGVLEVLGDLSLDLTVARFYEARHPYHPLLWDMQLGWRPHPRLTLAAIRGVMFGGSLWEGIDAHDIPATILGIKNYRENNVYSGSIEILLPTEGVQPLTAKLEWGSDDNPGAAVQWPGLVVGLSAPMLAGLPAALGVEYAYFGKGPFGYHDPFPWYSHGQYVGGWATGQTPLGDPLGGNGRALRLTAAADPWGGRVRLTGAAWLADRFIDNLYAPVAAGRSAGGRAEAELRLGRWAVGMSGSYERGEQGWSRGDVQARASAFF